MLVLLAVLPAILATVPPTPPEVKTFNNSVNVRTVLFRDSDTCRVCWSKHDLNLLIARRLVQDLIPRRIPKDFPGLLKYFSNIIELMKVQSNEKNIHTMLSALYDALGGYLHAVAIPVLNEAYYAGNIDYETTSQLHSMLGQMMEYLGTNGNNWAPPCDMRKIPTKVAALPIKMCKTQEACDAFVIPYLSSESNKTTNEESTDWCPEKTFHESKIPIPFLDDNAYPSAVAVPLKDHPLFSLLSECSVNLIPKYYILGMRCLSTSKFTNKDLVTFNKDLHHWIITKVVPHLHETSRWYPGFGSIMRVIETMNQRGLSSSETIKTESLPPPQKGNCADLPLKCDEDSEISVISGFPLWAIILIGVGALLLLFILCCCLHCCIVLRRRRREGFEECEEEEKAANPFVNIYCGLRKRKASKNDDKPETHSSEGYYESTDETEDEEE